jgi:hypothetical protein
MTPEPLTDSDFESLGNVLKRFGGREHLIDQVCAGDNSPRERVNIVVQS